MTELELQNLVAEYDPQNCFGGCFEPNLAANPHTVETAITSAALSSDGLHKHSHQRRLQPVTLETSSAELMARSNEITKCENFHSLWLLVRDALLPVRGAGELYIYDVSLRIGLFLKLSPERVYLHAGTRRGARALGLNWHKAWLEVSELPPALRELSPAQIEDFLCVMKDRLTTLGAN